MTTEDLGFGVGSLCVYGTVKYNAFWNTLPVFFKSRSKLGKYCAAPSPRAALHSSSPTGATVLCKGAGVTGLRHCPCAQQTRMSTFQGGSVITSQATKALRR